MGVQDHSNSTRISAIPRMDLCFMFSGAIASISSGRGGGGIDLTEPFLQDVLFPL